MNIEIGLQEISVSYGFFVNVYLTQVIPNINFLDPVGKKRLEPIGVLVFSIIIIISFVQVASQSVQRLIDGTREAVAVGFSATLIMIVTIVVKLICYVWCRSINSSSIQALAQDALTDVVFKYVL